MEASLILGGVGAVLLGVAAAQMLRRPDDAAPVGDYFGDVFPEWGGEPTQTADALDTMLTLADPGSWLPSTVSAGRAASNSAAFLRMIRFAEGTAGPDGYRTLFGGQLFDSYADHPRIYVPFRNTSSSAAGAYQILYRTFKTLQSRLGTTGFGPEVQDTMALELIRERGALSDVYAGRIPQAIAKVAKVWASMPGAGYDQPEKPMSRLLAEFQRAGGTLEQA